MGEVSSMILAFILAAALGASRPALTEQYSEECVSRAMEHADKAGYFGWQRENEIILGYLERYCAKRA